MMVGGLEGGQREDLIGWGWVVAGWVLEGWLRIRWVTGLYVKGGAVWLLWGVEGMEACLLWRMWVVSG